MLLGFTYASSEVHFRSTESQTFYRSIMTADDSIKCRCANSSMTGQVGGFQNPGVSLQGLPSVLPTLYPLFYLRHFFARSLTLVPRSLLLNRTETLAAQARFAAREIFFSQSVKHCPDLVSDASSLWNFCARSSAEVISQGN